jgi:hypothetical protein
VDIHAPELGCDVGGVAAAYWLFDWCSVHLFIFVYHYYVSIFKQYIWSIELCICVYVYNRMWLLMSKEMMNLAWKNSIIVIVINQMFSSWKMMMGIRV